MWADLLLILFGGLSAQAAMQTIQGYIYHEGLDDFRGLPKVKVELIDWGFFKNKFCGSTIADSTGFFKISCNPAPWRIDNGQRLKIYHRFDRGNCRVNVYRGRGEWGRVTSGNFSATYDDEEESDNSLCPADLYPV
ncbi:unnamed protein product [Bursaphelenchus xylophilus]|uniref:(pine wood nematode) hypothetical protein n=1 Tax=Bursaphelenchus xylophilus TaxID=6326 RepID=A0A1I7RUQ3_BURXY|nr:unnamed protein product [Bursaphelenchus xylophilus]CAG9114317.1 unnamed protein product [Bursaphelenchus xylophilus]